ncbi:MAG: amidophosphoribosyltransferase [Cyanobacteria bacterium NC_groundwater_1444_Ag_S-0.65um_54_12]|nr:amidophosphoribosyltransferase [Cyanobacteria bacterium NC_groundwater_1444_Ag_S-0.65um_54_12]
MCGILGLFDPLVPVAVDLYRGALALQHRGQEGAGLVTWERRFYLKTGPGLLSEVFQSVKLAELRGHIGLAHLRYATAGTGAENETQPFLLSFPFGLALVHNGNLTNHEELSLHLASGSWHLNSASDSEALLQVLADHLAQSDPRQLEPSDVFRAVARTMDIVEGAYSVIALIARHGLVAFRDPGGIRPLVLGRRGGAWAIASESVALDSLDFTLLRDVQPGEAVFIAASGTLHEAQLRTREAAHCAFEYIYMARPESVIDGQEVAEVRQRLGHALASHYSGTPDVVCDVPSSAEDVAVSFAAARRFPYRKGIRKNHYSQRTFITANQAARLGAINLKFHISRSVIAGKRLALVDDSIVRGNTARCLVKRLRQAGAKELHLLSAAPPIRYPCFYGVDMSIPEELVAAQATAEQVAQLLGVERLQYQRIEDLAGTLAGLSLCTACFSGSYPTEIPTADKRRLIVARREQRKL